MNLDVLKLKKSIYRLFLGLMLFVLAVDIFSIYGLSSIYLFQTAGLVFILLATLELKNVSKFFKISLILTIVGFVLVIGSATVSIIFPVTDVNALLNNNAVDMIEQESYTNAYFLMGVNAVNSIFSFLLLFISIRGISDYCYNYVPSMYQDSTKRVVRYPIFGGLYYLLTILQSVILIPQFNAYNQLVAAGGFKYDAETQIFEYGEEAYMTYATTTLKWSGVSIAYALFLLVYLVSMILTLSFISKVSRENPSKVQHSPIEDEFPTEAKNLMKDDWSEEFK